MSTGRVTACLSGRWAVNQRCIEVDSHGDDEGGKARHRRVLDANASDKPPLQPHISPISPIAD